LLIAHSRRLLARGAALCAQSVALRAHGAELRQRGAFASRRVMNLRNHSADLATVVLFQEQGIKPLPPRIHLQLLT
jgi:hypothetical protein